MRRHTSNWNLLEKWLQLMSGGCLNHNLLLSIANGGEEKTVFGDDILWLVFNVFPFPILI